MRCPTQTPAGPAAGQVHGLARSEERASARRSRRRAARCSAGLSARASARARVARGRRDLARGRPGGERQPDILAYARLVLDVRVRDPPGGEERQERRNEHRGDQPPPQHADALQAPRPHEPHPPCFPPSLSCLPPSRRPLSWPLGRSPAVALRPRWRAASWSSFLPGCRCRRRDGRGSAVGTAGAGVGARRSSRPSLPSSASAACSFPLVLLFGFRAPLCGSRRGLRSGCRRGARRCGPTAARGLPVGGAAKSPAGTTPPDAGRVPQAAGVATGAGHGVAGAAGRRGCASMPHLVGERLRDGSRQRRRCVSWVPGLWPPAERRSGSGLQPPRCDAVRTCAAVCSRRAPLPVADGAERVRRRPPRPPRKMWARAPPRTGRSESARQAPPREPRRRWRRAAARRRRDAGKWKAPLRLSSSGTLSASLHWGVVI